MTSQLERSAGYLRDQQPQNSCTIPILSFPHRSLLTVNPGDRSIVPAALATINNHPKKDDLVLFPSNHPQNDWRTLASRLITGWIKTPFYTLVINIEQNSAMIKNSTKQFKEKYSYSSAKKLQTIGDDKESEEQSQRSIRFNTTQFLSHIKSTPKLEKSKKDLYNTQPISLKKKVRNLDEKYSLFTDHTSIDTIHTIMKKKGIEDNQVERFRPEKLKKVTKISLQLRNSEDFIQNLPKNSLFFCCECFQYIFDIEKNRHFPDCKDQPNMIDRANPQLGIKKMEKVVQLAEYTKTKAEEVKELYHEFVKGTYKKLAAVEYPAYKFFTLQEIVYAFTYIFDQLLKNVKYVDDSSYFSCF